MKYDPERQIDADEWQSIDETEKTILAEDYHRRAGIELPNARLHASMHVIVENQIAMGDESPARETLDRLMEEGLDRHDAVHAIGSVVSRHVLRMLKGERTFDEEAYDRELSQLTAESWRNSGADD